MARYYNIDKLEPITGSRQLIQITECNSLGTPLGATGTKVIFEFCSIRFSPNPTTGGHFNIISLNGDVSTPFTFNNVIKWEGSVHGQTTTFALADLIISQIGT